VQSGDSAMISVRPERLSLVVDEKKANVLQCTVENITFLGSIVRILLRLEDQTFFMDTFNNPYLELKKIGDTVEVTFSRNAVLVLNQRVIA
jgi:putative spermidine/putrescine transport system ATP-binding protein